jgi:hypothetical protein
VPAQSRLTVSRAVAALRLGREALSDIEGQLGALLTMLHAPGARLDAAAPERLAGAARDAVAALSSLSEMKRLLPPPR